MNGRCYMTLAVLVALALVVPAAAVGQATAEQDDDAVPTWVNIVFGYHTDGQITDAELVTALRYLANQNIVHLAALEPEPASVLVDAALNVFVATGDAAVDAADDHNDANDQLFTAIDIAINAEREAIDMSTGAHRDGFNPVAIERAFAALDNDAPMSDLDAAFGDLYNAGIAVGDAGDAVGRALINTDLDSAPAALNDMAAAFVRLAEGDAAIASAAGTRVKALDAGAETLNARGPRAGGDAWTAAARAWADVESRAEAAQIEALATGDAAMDATRAASFVADLAEAMDGSKGRASMSTAEAMDGSKGRASMSTAAERAIEKARIIALQDINGPRECYTLLRSMERNLMEQDGAVSQIEYLRGFIGFAPDPNDPALQQSKSLLEQTEQRLNGLHTGYQTMKATYESYGQCR